MGGKHLEAAIDNIKTFGRIVLCGMISQYNVGNPYALPNLFQAIPNRLKLHGFIVRDHYDKSSVISNVVIPSSKCFVQIF